MYTYIHACTHLYAHIKIHTSMRQHTRTRTGLEIERARTLAHICTHTHITTHMHACTQSHVLTSTHAAAYIYPTSRMYAPQYKHTCCCIHISYVSAHTRMHTFPLTRSQAWRARTPADSGQRQLVYIDAIISNQTSSLTQNC